MFLLYILCGVVVCLPLIFHKRHIDKQQLQNYQQEIQRAQKQLQDTQEQIKNVEQQLNQAKANIDAQVNTYYTEQYNEATRNLSDSLDLAAEKLGANFQKEAKQAKTTYLALLSDLSSNYIEKQKELQELNTQLQIERDKISAVIEANKREDIKAQTPNKYKITISDIDLKEIAILESVRSQLRNKRLISKMIWENYYRTPTTEMINRVVGAGTHTGIYRITNIINGKSYVGQSVDIGERFKQHIKCGLGIDASNNKLYTAMLNDGLQAFTFEVLQECTKQELNAQEIYWIAFYKTQEYGYNMSRGGA